MGDNPSLPRDFRWRMTDIRFLYIKPIVMMMIIIGFSCREAKLAPLGHQAGHVGAGEGHQRDCTPLEGLKVGSSLYREERMALYTILCLEGKLR